MTADEVIGIVLEAEKERGLRVEWDSVVSGFNFCWKGRAYQADILTIKVVATGRWVAETTGRWNATMWRKHSWTPDDVSAADDLSADHVRQYLDKIAPRAPSVEVVIEKLRAKKHGTEKLAKILAVLSDPGEETRS